MPHDNLHTDESSYYSNSVQEIISRHPGFWVRKGTVVLFVILALSLTGTWFIKYPEIITTNAILISANAPKAIATQPSGKLIALLVKDGENVQSGDVIGCMESAADWKEVLQLSATIDTLINAIDNKNYDKISTQMEHAYFHLGELQNTYQLFTQSYIPFRDHTTGDYGKQKEALLKQDEKSQLNTRQAAFMQALYNLKSKIEEWKFNYVLIATTNGRLSYASILQENQQLQNGQIIAYITPGSGDYYMQTIIPQNNLGKIARGQKVLIKFPSYSWQEFGSVQGRVDYISQIATDSGYMARITLVNGLQTSHHKQIPYRQGLTAQAEIITKDVRLLERFYNNLTKKAY